MFTIKPVTVPWGSAMAKKSFLLKIMYPKVQRCNQQLGNDLAIIMWMFVKLG
jgi:hypothetical protein